MEYPRLELVSNAELIEHFTLQPGDYAVLDGLRSHTSRLGCAVLMKSLCFLGYTPRDKSIVPENLVSHLAIQLDVRPERFRDYRWEGRSWEHHLSVARTHVGLRPFESGDFDTILEWFASGTTEFSTRKDLVMLCIFRCRELGLELPSEKKLFRLVGSARRQLFNDLCSSVHASLDSELQIQIGKCLEEPETKQNDPQKPRFDWLKTPAGKTGMKTFLEEIAKLKAIRSLGVDRNRHLQTVSDSVLRELKARARAEDAFQMRRHPESVRMTYMAAFLVMREAEITDQIIQIFLQLIRRIENKADRTIEKRILKSIKKVFGKDRILFRIARASTEQPDETVRDVVFPVVGEDTLLRLVEEAEQEDVKYEVVRTRVVHTKYRTHYRRMVKPILETLTFRSENPALRPLMDAIDLIQRHFESKNRHYPKEEKIPTQLLTGHWKDAVFEDTSDGERVVRHLFELCALFRLERALKCKEVWVKGAYKFRNPDEDLPVDWDQHRVAHYEKRGLKQDTGEFVEGIRREMRAGLEELQSYLGVAQTGDVQVVHPGGGGRAHFHIPKLIPKPERPILIELKDRVHDRWGILDLLDILVEANRQVGFSRFFSTTGQRQVLDSKEAEIRLLLTIYALGTNVGLSRIHSAARPRCSYDDLRYFFSRFITIDALREANAALVNRILEIRNPEIWGYGTACASDAKHLGAWDQNIMTEWHPHYRGRGVMVYWHVESNSTCIYSQLKTCTSSEVSTMIQGLVRHDSEMRFDTNYVDSHGQSEVAFAFCRLLGFELLPRLKRLKHEQLYLPDKGLTSDFPELAGVLARPIRWHHIQEQYDEMVRHVVAISEGTGPVESILRRFNRNNRAHPTYKAFIELGKALKTVFLCKVLRQQELRQEINEALNVVESWNACTDFICFGRKTELQSNDPEIQELVILAVQLLQNALILTNTLMLQSVLRKDRIIDRMEPEDRKALTPLFTSNVNPYGDFNLDLEKPSYLEAA